MLTDLTFNPIYDSSECSIVKDLLIPALSNSTEYWRGVGFFSSGWLQLTATGIEKIAEKGGKIRFIVSPLVSAEDQKAFSLAKDAKSNSLLQASLRKNLNEIASNLQNDLLNTFAWLLSDDIIEFKFAVAKNNLVGDYHDKVGVCVDNAKNLLAFHGSFNDTYKGSLNGEAFSVFQSWIGGQDIYAKEHFKRLQNLWFNGNTQFNVYPFDEAIKQDFICLRTSENRPYRIPNSMDRKDDRIEIGTTAPHNPFTLKTYQKDAVSAWFNNHCRGIFEMATGTGKTITSISAALELFLQNKRLFLVIIVPFTHLLEQWKENCEKFCIETISCYGDNPKWRGEMHSLILKFRTGTQKLACALVVQNTACSDDFLNCVERIPAKNFMMIADETHYLGARYLQKALFPTATFRLGLSATPERWMDEFGTQVLRSYYEKTVASMSLEEAINGGFLTPYKYYPIPIELTDDETQEYIALSKEIGQLFSLVKNGKSSVETEEKLERLRLRRAKIIAQASNKTLIYNQLLSQLQSEQNGLPLRDLLVFCAPGTHNDILRITNSAGLKAHEFVHDVDGKTRRAVLDAFSKGDIEAIISIKCMDEGVDVPSTKTAVFLASTTNPKEFIQRRGRVLRKSKGKTYASIYDFIVIPPHGADKDAAQSILRRELPRFSEFADAAVNKYVARGKMLSILEEFGMQMYIDVKPWEIYQTDLQEGEY